MLTFAPGHGFHARLDLPPPDVPLDEWVELLLAPARQHGVDRVAFVAYADDAAPAERAVRRLVQLFREAGIDVVEALRADGRRWWPVLPGGEPPGDGMPYDVGSHPFAAHAVVEGVVVHESRDHLAATLAPVAERLRAGPGHRGRARSAVGVEHRSRGSRASGRSADDRRRGAAAPGRARRRGRPRRRLAGRVPRADAAAHVAVWTDLVRRAPDELLGDAAGVLAMVAWIAGHGALAWCAVDRCRSVEPGHTLAAVVADLLAAAVSPRRLGRAGAIGPPGVSLAKATRSRA